MSQGTVFSQTATERVHIGANTADAVADEAIQANARRVFLLVSATLDKNTEEIARVRAALGQRYAGQYSGMPPHGPRSAVLQAATQARAVKADLIVSIGGGSVTDAAKVVTICLKHKLEHHEDLNTYHMSVGDEGVVNIPEFAPPDVRVVSVPTTLSGGEFNPLSGCTDEQAQLKQGYLQRFMAPVAVVLDPAITVHTPEWLWLSTGVRALDHALETLGSFQSNAFCDGMAENALKQLGPGLIQVKRDPNNLDARLACQIGAWQSMVPVVAGVPMGISHATGHALGGTFDVPHGHTSCVMAPFALAYNKPANGERQKRISAALGAPQKNAATIVAQLIRDLGMPCTLGEVGVGEQDLPKLADAVMHDIWTRTNPRQIDSKEQVLEFVHTAL